MHESARNAAAGLLLLSALMLAVLVPGGPIETRDFSHIEPLVLGAFNAFLTALGLLSLLVPYFILKGSRTAFVISALCGTGYLIVYLLDLARIFPVSPVPMPVALWWIEVAGVLVSIPLIGISIIEAGTSAAYADTTPNVGPFARAHAGLLAMLAVAGICIVVFATYSAMGR